METHKRSLVKTITWRAIATLLTIAGMWMLTGEWAQSALAGVALNALKAGCYYAHERAWDTVSWGRGGKDANS